MAEYCKKCIEEVMGLKEGDKYYQDWLVEEGYICEGCGYDYLNMEEQKLIGKRIVKAEIKGIEGFDDMPYLFLTMEDGSIFKVTSCYDGYTGKSNDEYPRFIKVEELGEKEE